MLVGQDTVEVFRKGKPNRDGDSDWELVGRIVRCSVQVEGLRGIEHVVRSDGVRRFASESDATLYLWAPEDVRKGDRVKDVHTGSVFLVNTEPIRHVMPSGQLAGLKCFMDNVEKW